MGLGKKTIDFKIFIKLLCALSFNVIFMESDSSFLFFFPYSVMCFLILYVKNSIIFCMNPFQKKKKKKSRYS